MYVCVCVCVCNRERWGVEREREVGVEREREKERTCVPPAPYRSKCVLNNQSCRPSVWSVRLQSCRSRSPLFYLLYFSVLRVTWL